jgi:hypothetical protein
VAALESGSKAAAPVIVLKALFLQRRVYPDVLLRY